MKINVTEEDINLGQGIRDNSRSTSCPVSLSIQRSLNLKNKWDAVVGLTSAVVLDKIYDFPLNLCKFIEAADANHKWNQHFELIPSQYELIEREPEECA